MTIPEVMKKYRQEQQLSSEKFGCAILERFPEKNLTRQAVNHWETGKRSPERIFLLKCTLVYGDWRRDWALECLHALYPDLYPALLEDIHA